MQFEQLGPYRLGKQLGQGGMGAVYEGFDVTTNEQAAIKVLSPALAADAGFRVRFEAEIESLKKLCHPNIVRLYGYGEQADTLFYAMELVRGTSLEEELRRGRRFDWREVTQFATKLCRALKHAHDHGVIHRDLKPANLLLTPDGDVKLSDFGIARLFGNTRLTSDGGVLGTAEYMAPEQADGRTLTDRCDQYSLGGVMYTLLAGRPPFRAANLVQMLHMQRYAEPEPLSKLAPQTPGELVRIVHQLLSKDPQQRFPNALILGRSLEAMERGLSLPPKTQDTAQQKTPSVEVELDDSDYLSLGPTLSPEELSQASSARDISFSPRLTPPQATDLTTAIDPPTQLPPELPAAAAADAPASGRFIKVDEQHESRASFGETLAALFAPQTLALVLALGLLATAGWYLMRPESADALYERISAAAATGEPERLQAAEREMSAFLERFPDDPRAESVQTLADEMKQSSPIERAYAEALRLVIVNPEQALVQFQALVDVYDDGTGGAERSDRYVKLSHRQVARLRKRVEAYVAEGRAAIDLRLDRADELATSDPPAAEKIYGGVVQLYRDKTWADDLVERAQQGLQEARKQQAAR